MPGCAGGTAPTRTFNPDSEIWFPSADSTLAGSALSKPHGLVMRERVVRRSNGAIEPCLPSPAKRLPAGPGWIHEIKHDGFRLLARRDGEAVRLPSRKGNDLGRRFLGITPS